MLFELKTDSNDFACPECNSLLSITWDTEYGDPVVGQHETANCPVCRKKIGFECWIEYRGYKILNKEQTSEQTS